MINYAVESHQPSHTYMPFYQLLAGTRFQCVMLLVQPSCLPITEVEMLQSANEATCHICLFVSQSMESVVRTTFVSDIKGSCTKLPFTTRSAWLAIQCPDLRMTCAYPRPFRKATNINDIKRYLDVATVASDGLLVTKRNEPFVPANELIIIPRSVLHDSLPQLIYK